MTQIIFEKSINGMTGVSLTEKEIIPDYLPQQFLRKVNPLLPQALAGAMAYHS